MNPHKAFRVLAILAGVALWAINSGRAQSGAVDTSFVAPGTLLGEGRSWLAADNKVFVKTYPAKGIFTTKLIRLSENGSIDANFNPDFGVGFSVTGAGPQADGSVLVAGNSDSSSREARIVKVLANGAKDPAYAVTLDSGPGAIFMKEAGAGKTWVYGAISNVNGARRAGLARLNGDGSVDPFFNLKTNAYTVTAVAEAPNGDIVLNAVFIHYDIVWTRLLRAKANGDIDETFAFNAPHSSGRLVAVDGQNRVLVAGEFYDPVTRGIVIWRLLPDGGIDPSFKMVTTDGIILAMELQADGKILAGGGFKTLNGEKRASFGRLNADGSLDSTFVSGVDFPVRSIATRSDGRMIVSGETFDAVESVDRGRVARIWGDQFLKLESLLRDGGGTVSLGFANTTMRSWTLENSSDLVVWEVVSTNDAATLIVNVAGSGAGKFYRGVVK